MYMGNNNNNGYCPQGGQGWNQTRPYYQGGNNNNNFSNQPSLKDLVFAQAKTTYALSKKLAAYDKTLENINVKLDGFASAFQNQLSFNKMIETQLAQLAAFVPANESGRIPRQPESSVENVKVITMRGGKSTRDLPYPNRASTSSITREAPSSNTADEEVQPKKTVPQEYCDTRLLPLTQRSMKPNPEDPHQRAIVGCYASANMHTLSQGHPQQQVTAHDYGSGQADEAVHQCHTPQAPGKEEGSRVSHDHLLDQVTAIRPSRLRPWSKCKCHAQRHLQQAHFTVLAPTPMRLQLANSSVRYLAGIAEDVLVKIWTWTQSRKRHSSL
uniref:OSIGBa0105P02.1 protein n=1 Tax=Oryza sativa TaxID=4530 RepID=Q01KU4_ORYSA|nr:OSIGBa0147J02.5 [Oryza sativa]CAH66627.1 OSIGBa0105P02.1 [Oryza sativa]